VRILNEAAAYSRRLSGSGWRPGQFEAEMATGGLLAQAFDRGDVYLVWDGDRSVATVTLQWTDELHWPGAAEDAGYVHRLAVADDAHGRGIGRALIAWSEDEARARGKRFLRLDTTARNAVLRRYYEEEGFELRGEKAMEHWNVVLFERPIPGF
jgi:GNAT superfamily N-acetyltransferase